MISRRVLAVCRATVVSKGFARGAQPSNPNQLFNIDFRVLLKGFTP